MLDAKELRCLLRDQEINKFGVKGYSNIITIKRNLL